MRKKPGTEENTAPAIVCTAPWRLTQVKALPNYSLEVTFTDGTCGHVEMKSLIMSEIAGVFASLKDVSLFNQVSLEHGAVTWPGGIDLAPDAMHDEIKEHGKWVI